VSSNPQIYKMNIDPLKELVPVIQLSRQPMVLAAHPSLGVASLAELIALAKQQPGLRYATGTGVGAQHMVAQWFASIAGIKLEQVPYRGGAPALNDLIGGHIPLSVNNVPEAKAQIDAGAVRPLGVTTAMRSPVLPNVPTVAESGLPGYDTGLWWGVVAPAGLPAAVKAKLEKDVADAVKSPAVAQRLLGLGATPIGSTSQEFSALIRAEYDKWGPVIKAAGIRGE